MESIDSTLERAESSVADGNGLAGTGFWGLVRDAKQRPDEYDLDRIAAIDRLAFEQWALLTIPVSIGTSLAVIAVVGGVALATLAGTSVLGDLVFLLGFGMVLVASHGLGHLLVGKAVGMRFTHWFVGTLGRPQPGVKVDYATYLRVPARQRAWMHASGAIITKIVPFIFLPVAFATEVSSWVPMVLAIVGVGGIVTDLVWSTKVSDWKKFRREMRLTATP